MQQSLSYPYFIYVRGWRINEKDYEICRVVLLLFSAQIKCFNNYKPVVATTIKNANVALIFQFLHRVVEVSERDPVCTLLNGMLITLGVS